MGTLRCLITGGGGEFINFMANVTAPPPPHPAFIIILILRLRHPFWCFVMSWWRPNALFSSILSILCFSTPPPPPPPSAWFCTPYLTFYVCWSQITTWELNSFHYSCYLPTYTTHWRSLSSPTALFSSILSILCFLNPFSLIFDPLIWPFMCAGVK